MKKTRKIFLLFIALSFLLSCSVSAADIGELPSEFEKLIDELPREIGEHLPNEIYSKDAQDVANAVGKMSDIDYVMTLVGKTLGLELRSKLSLFASLTGTILLVAVFHAFKVGLADGAFSKAIGFCSTALIFALITASLMSDLETVKIFFERIGALMVGVIPTVGVVYAMGGNVTTAASSSGMLYFVLSFCETVCAKTVIPVAAMLTAFSLCGALSPSVKISSLSSALKKCYTLFLTLVMSLLLFVLSSQTLLSASADSITARAAKLMASSAIPIVGGSVGDTLRTVGATVSYIKSVDRKSVV